MPGYPVIFLSCLDYLTPQGYTDMDHTEACRHRWFLLASTCLCYNFITIRPMSRSLAVSWIYVVGLSSLIIGSKALCWTTWKLCKWHLLVSRCFSRLRGSKQNVRRFARRQMHYKDALEPNGDLAFRFLVVLCLKLCTASHQSSCHLEYRNFRDLNSLWILCAQMCEPSTDHAAISQVRLRYNATVVYTLIAVTIFGVVLLRKAVLIPSMTFHSNRVQDVNMMGQNQFVALFLFFFFTVL